MEWGWGNGMRMGGGWGRGRGDVGGDNEEGGRRGRRREVGRGLVEGEGGEGKR